MARSLIVPHWAIPVMATVLASKNCAVDARDIARASLRGRSAPKCILGVLRGQMRSQSCTDDGTAEVRGRMRSQSCAVSSAPGSQNHAMHRSGIGVSPRFARYNQITAR